MLLQDNLIGGIAYTTTVNCEAFDGWMPVEISVSATTHITYANLSLFGTTYTFTISKWASPLFCRSSMSTPPEMKHCLANSSLMLKVDPFPP